MEEIKTDQSRMYDVIIAGGGISGQFKRLSLFVSEYKVYWVLVSLRGHCKNSEL